MDNEIWVPITGFEAYAVSNLGRVKRIAGGAGTKPAHPLLTPTPTTSGYLKVRMQRNGLQVNKLIAPLVATAFIGPRPPGCEVNHIDGDKTNNCAGNLEWLTHPANLRHAYATGLRVPGPKLPRTECRRGHSYDEANTLYSQGGRRCRACDRITHQAQAERVRIALAAYAARGR